MSSPSLICSTCGSLPADSLAFGLLSASCAVNATVLNMLRLGFDRRRVWRTAAAVVRHIALAESADVLPHTSITGCTCIHCSGTHSALSTAFATTSIACV